MIEKLRGNKFLSYFVLYCVTFTFYGATVSAIGPVIPYLADRHKVPEVAFTYVFTCRSVGFLVGAVFVKALTLQAIHHHTIAAAACVLGGITFVIIPFTTSFAMYGVYFFVNSVANCTFQIIINMCCLRVHRGYHEDYWLQLAHGLFGIGALVGPLFVRIFGLYAVAMIGVGTMVGFPGYLYLKTPQMIKEEPNQLSQKINQTESSVPIGKWSFIMLGVLFFLYYGEEIGFSGWISSYAVMLDIDNKEGATRYPFLFWISITLTRFLLAGFPGTVTHKFTCLIKGQIVCFGLSLLFVWLEWLTFSVYWNSLLSGLCFSSMYAFLYTLPLDFGQEIDPKKTAFLIMVGSVGEGVLTTLIGLVMKYISVHGLVVCMLTFGVGKLIIVKMLVSRMKNEEICCSKDYLELQDLQKPK